MFHDADTFNIFKDAILSLACSTLVYGLLLCAFLGFSQAKFKRPIPDIAFTDFGCKCEKTKFIKGFAQVWKLTVWATNEDTTPTQKWERVYSQYPVERPDAIKKALEDCRNWMAFIEHHFNKSQNGDQKQHDEKRTIDGNVSGVIYRLDRSIDGPNTHAYLFISTVHAAGVLRFMGRDEQVASNILYG